MYYPVVKIVFINTGRPWRQNSGNLYELTLFVKIFAISTYLIESDNNIWDVILQFSQNTILYLAVMVLGNIYTDLTSCQRPDM